MVIVNKTKNETVSLKRNHYRSKRFETSYPDKKYERQN